MQPLFRCQSSQNLSVSGMDKPLQAEETYAHSVSGGAGGRGTKISTATNRRRFGSSFGRWYDNQAARKSFDILSIWSEKLSLQQLNDRLAAYLEKVNSLEKANSALEIKIRKAIEKKSLSEGKDYSKYSAIIADLREKIFDMHKCNAVYETAIDNASIAAEDFKGKFEYEAYLRHIVKSDDAKLRKSLDDTNLVRLQLESDIEYMREELILLKKGHESDVAELHAQITHAGVHVDVDAPRGQDLNEVLEELRDRYEKIVQKNKEELESWHETKVKKVRVQVTENSTALKEATGALSKTKRKLQDLEIQVQSECFQNASLENNLHDLQKRYRGTLSEYETYIEMLQQELNEIENSKRIYKLSTEELEAEIKEYRRLLEGSGASRVEKEVQSKKI